MPRITRALLVGEALVTLPCLLQLTSPLSFVLFWPLVRRGQIWRMATAFLFGGTGFPLIFNTVSLYQMSQSLEKDKFLGNSADYLWCIVVLSALLFVRATLTGAEFPSRNAGLLSSASLCAICTLLLTVPLVEARSKCAGVVLRRYHASGANAAIHGGACLFACRRSKGAIRGHYRNCRRVHLVCAVRPAAHRPSIAHTSAPGADCSASVHHAYVPSAPTRTSWTAAHVIRLRGTIHGTVYRYCAVV